MQPFFFGSSREPLYGVVHEPTGRVTRTSSVIICNPLGHEYIRRHEAIRKLAISLAASGFYVLRFDYRGTGDSSGDFANITFERLSEDIKLATEEVRALSGSHRISVVGLRIGAMLAFLANADCNFDQLILWDPVLDGNAYLENLKTMQLELCGSSWYYSKPRSQQDLQENEFLGYCYSGQLLAQIELFNIQSFPYQSESTFGVVSSPIQEKTSLKIAVEQITDRGDWSSLINIETNLSTLKIQNHITELVINHA